MSIDALAVTRRGFITGAALSIGCLAAPSLSLGSEMTDDEICKHIDDHAQSIGEAGNYLPVAQLNSPYSCYLDAGNSEFIEVAAEDGSTFHAVKASGLLGWLDDTTVFDGALYITLAIASDASATDFMILGAYAQIKEEGDGHSDQACVSTFEKGHIYSWEVTVSPYLPKCQTTFNYNVFHEDDLSDAFRQASDITDRLLTIFEIQWYNNPAIAVFVSVSSGETEDCKPNLGDLVVLQNELGWKEGQYVVAISPYCYPGCQHITKAPEDSYFNYTGNQLIAPQSDPNSWLAGCEYLHPDLNAPTEPFSIVVKCKDSHDKTLASQTIEFPDGIVPGAKQETACLCFDEADIVLTPDKVEYEVIQADGTPYVPTAALEAAQRFTDSQK